MISISRQNLFSLLSNPNSFRCNSNAHFFLSIHFFSTSKVRKSLTPCPKMYDVFLHNHRFSPDLAFSLASSHSPTFTSPKRADLVLSFLKENSFTVPQLEKIVRYNPRILGFTFEGLQFRLKLFRDLGLSSEEIAKMMVQNTAILHSSVQNRIVPSLSILKGLLGSNDEVARIIRKSAWFITRDLEKSLMPNVEILKSSGAPMERVLRFLYAHPRCFLMKPDIMRKSLDKAIEFGVPQTSVAFMQAVSVFASTSQAMWELKLQTLHDLGFSDDEIFVIFRRHPHVLSQSQKKLKNVVELLLGTGKYNISDIVTNSGSLGYSIEKRLEPRLQILGLLETRNLIEKWPGLSRIATSTVDKFFDTYIKPYYDEIGEEYISKIHAEGKSESNIRRMLK